MSLYKRICDDNRIKYGTQAEKILKIIINQYSDRTHFIYEILQNAEDAGAEHIRFRLERDRLLIFHNGRPFNEEDIEGVCGIAGGTKEDGTRIGHFGIGFKSVYCYTQRPRIYSGRYHFVIQNQLFPEEIPSRPGLEATQTCMILPFDKADVPTKIAYQEIRDALIRKIRAESILILNHISDIEIDIDGHPDVITINKAKYPLGRGGFERNVFSLSLQTTVRNRSHKTQRTQDADYLFFTDDEKEASAVIFRVDGKELKAVKNSKVYAFFPTAKEAHLNFYIHAPFDTTPARDNFKEGAEYGKHNLRLIRAIGELIWFAFRWMRDNHYLSLSGFHAAFPIYEYEEDDILYGLYQNSVDIIREEAILPTNQPGVFQNVRDVIVPLWGVITDVFSDEDLRRLLNNRSFSWLAKEFSTDAYSDLRRFLNRNFSMRTLDWKDLVMRIDSTYLKQKDLSWFEKLFSRIETYCIRRSTSDGHFVDASRIPFVRTARGEQICARDASGNLLVYLNNPDSAAHRIDSAFLGNETIRGFYRNALRIPEYNIEQEVIGNILPKYARRDPAFRTDDPLRENVNDLKVIKDAVYTNPLILKRLQDQYIVTDGSGWYRPDELYIRSDDTRAGYALVQGIAGIRYLSDRYFSGSMMTLKLDEAFFQSIGCHKGIRNIAVSSEEYLRAVRRYLGPRMMTDLRQNIFRKTYISTRLNWAFSYEGFPQVFEDMSPGKSAAIARFLNPHVMEFDISGELTGADDQHFSGKNVDSMMAYSMLGMQLAFEKWIYIEGDSQPHCPAETDREDLLPLYRPYKRLMGALPFKEAKSALTEWLDENIDNEADRELIRHCLSNPEKLAEAARALSRSEAQAEAGKKKTKTVGELLARGNRDQKNPAKDSDFEVSAISEKGKEKRTQNLDRELAASLDEFTYVAKGLTFASRRSNEEERSFLEQEYDGHCQICQNQITKYNGEHYFEAINIMKFSQLPEKLRGSGRYGWNSLCLCPNCAAEYNYCSKKISTLYEQVMAQEVQPDSAEPIGITLEMPLGRVRQIHYSPRHFIALKEALKIFADQT